jgi:hypothetical protein
MAPAHLIGEVAMVTIADSGTNSLFGALASHPAANAASLFDMRQA